MSTLVESLKRLYAQGRVTKEKLEEMKKSGKITDKEFAYITGETDAK